MALRLPRSLGLPCSPCTFSASIPRGKRPLRLLRCSADNQTPPSADTRKVNLARASITTLLPLLQKCNSGRKLERLVARFVVFGISKDSVAVSNIVKHCAAWGIGNLNFILLLLKQVEDPHPILWNTAIRRYELSNSSWSAIYLYHQMLENLVFPDKFTFPFVLKACANIRAFEEGKQIHCHVLKSRHKVDTYVQDALILMYSRCGKMDDAHLAFDLMPHRKLICWNMMIDGYIKQGDMESAWNLFDCMPQHDIFSWNLMIDGYAKHKQIAAARKLFDEMPARDIISWNSMVDGYAKCGDMGAARDLFDQMSLKDVISWGSMINGYVKSGYVEMAHSLFEKTPYKSLITWNSLMHGYAKSVCVDKVHKLFTLMPIRNSTSYNVMLDAYVKGGEIEMAQNLFTSIPNKDIVSWNIMIDGYGRVGNLGCSRTLFNALPNKDVISWNALISGYKQNGFSKETFELFHDMLESGEKPDYCTLAIILSAIADLGLCVHGRWIHAYVERNYYPICGIVGVAIIDMYSKCGYVDTALQFFNHITQKTKDHWNSLISGVSVHGNAVLAISLFEQMEQSNVRPDDITFVSILNACSHAGLVLQGQLYFELMDSKYGITPTLQHYGCMVDILSRSGELVAAMELVTNMPMSPNDVVWRALLAASTNHGYTEIAKIAARQLTELVPNDSSSYVLLCNIYVSSCQFESARNMWNLMKDRFIAKNPGCSSIELQGAVHEFRAGDTSHTETGKIHLLLKNMSPVLMVEGYVPNTKYSLDGTSIL